jgi:hypothetical protein
LATSSRIVQVKQSPVPESRTCLSPFEVQLMYHQMIPLSKFQLFVDELSVPRLVLVEKMIVFFAADDDVAIELLIEDEVDKDFNIGCDVIPKRRSTP